MRGGFHRLAVEVERQEKTGESRAIAFGPSDHPVRDDLGQTAATADLMLDIHHAETTLGITLQVWYGCISCK